VSEGFPPGLLLITNRAQARRPLTEICRAALDAGFAAVMLREKDLGARALLELAAPVHEVCATAGRPFLINDRLDVALALPGAGVHLGAAGIPVADARRLLGPDRRLGYSAHEVNEARAALDAGADYVTLSPVFQSGSKPSLVPRGVEFLREAVVSLPRGRVLALAGIDPTNIGEVREAGAAGAAIMGEVMAAEDPRAAAAALVEAWKSR